MKYPIRRKRRPDTAALRQVPMFRVAPVRSLEQLAVHTDVLRLPAGRVVAYAGQPAGQFLAVVEGEAQARTADGHLESLAAGTVIGARALLDGTTHTATVTTRTETTFVVIEGPAFRLSAREIPAIADHLPVSA